MATLAERLAYYANLLAVQYRTQPKARATVTIIGKQLIADNLADQIQQGFWIDTAVGAQLDILGQYIGLPRNIGLPAAQPFFGFYDNEELDPTQQNPNGLTDSTDAGINAQSIFYDSTSQGNRNTDLSDTAYRWMLKLKIVLNSNDGTLASIVALLETMLPDTVTVIDNQNMSVTYEMVRRAPVPIEVIQPYLPKPMGVRVVFLVFSATPDVTSRSGSAWASRTVTTAAVTVTPANGTGPFTYQWERLSETRPDFPDFPGTVANTPNAAATTFSHTFGAGAPVITSVSTWKCVVTDSLGFVAETPTITVTTSYVSPP